MMKHFPRTMLTLVCLAAVAMMSSSASAQTGPKVIANALVASVSALDFSNPFDPAFVSVQVIRTANAGYTLTYGANDFGFTFYYAGSGSIPASAVQVSGGSLNAGKVTFTLNVNTCDLGDSFTTISGTCGNLNLTWVEVPTSIGGSYATRGDTVQTLPGGSKIITNGEQLQVGASLTGSILNGTVATPGFGQLTQQTNVTVTVTR